MEINGIEMTKKDLLQMDIFLSVIIAIVISFVHHVSYQDWSLCKTYHVSQVQEELNEYDNLQCADVIKSGLDSPKSVIETEAKAAETEVTTYHHTASKHHFTLTDMASFIVVLMFAAATNGLNAIPLALHFNCFLLAITIFLSPWILLTLIGFRKILPLTLITFIISYGIVVSRLYGFYYNPFVIFFSFGSGIACIFFIAIFAAMSVIGMFTTNK